jgi:serine/threonine protein kinase
MSDERDDLERVAAAVADGESVDWQHEDRTNRHLKGMLDRLRVIEKIAEVHRTPPSQRVTPKVESDPTRTIEPQACDAPVPPLPFTRWGHLEVGELIGSGGFGEVYRARDPHLQKTVALKLVRADRAADARGTTRFLLEARRLARVTHENVLQVHGADVHEGRAGLWTDLIKGRTLEEILREEGRRGCEEAILIGRKMCMALAAVHAEGLTHHDVKTGNIMRGEAGRYVLMDFSTTTDRLDAGAAPGADAVHPAGDAAAGTAGGHAPIGTPGFMAPERFVGRDSGRASDVYSLGVVLYRLVTGRFPIEAASTDALYQMHRRGESIPLRDLRPDLPDAFIRVVERALEPDPARRFTSMGEMDRALAEVLGGQVPKPLPDPDPAPPPFPSWAWLRDLVDRTPVRAVVALVIVVVSAIVVLNWPTPLRVDVQVFRAAVEGDRFTTRSGEPLASGAAVAPEDRLYLEIEGNDPMHVYVLNHDEAGAAWILFPLPDSDLQNPLPNGTSHLLPGTIEGEENFWVVSSVGGEEEFLVIASRDPLKNFERQIAGIPPAGSAGAATLSARAIGTLRGIGGLAEASEPAGNDPWRPLAGIVEGIKERAEDDGGIWAWAIRLQNPGAEGGRP